MNHKDVLTEFNKLAYSLYESHGGTNDHHDNPVKFYLFLIDNINILSKDERDKNRYICYLFRSKLLSKQDRRIYIDEFKKVGLSLEESQKILNYFLKSKYRAAFLVTLFIAFLFCSINFIDGYLNLAFLPFKIPIFLFISLNIGFLLLTSYFIKQWKDGK